MKKRSGFTLYLIPFLVILILMIASAVFELIRLFSEASRMRNHLEMAITSSVTENFYEVFTGIREGTSSTARWNGKWEEGSTTLDVSRRIAEAAGGTANGSISENSGAYLLRIQQLTQHIPPRGTENTAFHVEASGVLTLYVRILGLRFPFDIPLSVKSTFLNTY